MKITVLDTAEQDLLEGFHFYERQSAGLGTYFLDSLFSDIDSLAWFAGSHIQVFGHYRLLSKRFPFAIYYQLVVETVLVVAVLDCRRKPSWIRGKLGLPKE